MKAILAVFALLGLFTGWCEGLKCYSCAAGTVCIDADTEWMEKIDCFYEGRCISKIVDHHRHRGCGSRDECGGVPDDSVQWGAGSTTERVCCSSNLCNTYPGANSHPPEHDTGPNKYWAAAGSLSPGILTTLLTALGILLSGRGLDLKPGIGRMKAILTVFTLLGLFTGWCEGFNCYSCSGDAACNSADTGSMDKMDCFYEAKCISRVQGGLWTRGCGGHGGCGGVPDGAVVRGGGSVKTCCSTNLCNTSTDDGSHAHPPGGGGGGGGGAAESLRPGILTPLLAALGILLKLISSRHSICST